MKKKVLLGMSGGVDSSVAAHLLIEEGYDVEGVTMRLFADGDKEVEATAEKLGIKHRFVNLKDFFWETIIESFASDYKMGLTPNPCILCNKKIKFGSMYEYAMEEGFDYLSTGHYANILEEAGKFYLKKAEDRTKDQTYFLYNLTQDILAHVLFPLGKYSKARIREIAKELGFKNYDKKDSQDICFTDDENYADFLINSCKLDPLPGDFIDIAGKKIGRHKGLIYYTIGQRKGLGQSFGKPMYVLAKDQRENTITLGENKDLCDKEIQLENINIISGDYPASDISVEAKIRYNQELSEAVLSGDGKLIFNKGQRAVAPGQSAVFYRGDYLMGGGVITLK